MFAVVVAVAVAAAVSVVAVGAAAAVVAVVVGFVAFVGPVVECVADFARVHALVCWGEQLLVVLLCVVIVLDRVVLSL